MAGRRKRKTSSSTTDDPATAYAIDVVDGTITAGPHVRAACARHLRDLQTGHKRGLYWDPEAALRAIRFFREKLVVDLTAGDKRSDADTKPFNLLLWQCFIVGSIFGWKRANGYRRFNMAFIETGKGSGKSPIAAGVGLYMLTADGEFRAEVYAAATKKDQAKVLFRDAVAMVEKSPELIERLHLSGGAEKTNIAYLSKGSFFRPISTEDRGKTGQSGPRPHCSLLDEIHEHPTNDMVEMMRAGIKSRRQPLTFMITNSGSDRTSVCFEYHDYGAKVCAGVIEDDSFFAYICALDDKDDPFTDEGCWPKANPGLGDIIQPDYLREQVRQARGMPSKENLVRRLNFCQWTDADAAWLSKETWMACEHPLDFAKLAKRRCHAGLDLSGKRDLTALAFAFEPDPDGVIDAFVEFWSPKDTLKDRGEADRVPYVVWAKDGHLDAVPGASIDYAYVAKRLGARAAEFELVQLGYDRYRIDDLIAELDAEGVDCWKATKDPNQRPGTGIKMVEHGQGFVDMGKAVDALEEVIVNGKLRVHTNPVLRWNVASAVLEMDPAGSKKFTKRKSTGRIDGVVALAMAVRLASIKGDRPPEYQMIIL